MTLRTICEYDQETNSWGIYCPKLLGLTSCGDTEGEAISNFHEAIDLFFTPDEMAVPTNSRKTITARNGK